MNLKEIRKKHSLSQLDMALLCGVSLNTYTLWERGGMKPNEENQAKLNEVIENLKKQN